MAALRRTKTVLQLIMALVPAVATAEQTPCEVAKSAAEDFLAGHALSGRVSCRANERAEAGATLVALPVQALRAGPVVWPVKVQTAAGRSYVRQVALSINAAVDGWVASRKLTSGMYPQAEDFRRESRTWPAGTLLPANGEEFPPKPVGRLIRDLHAGEWVDARSMAPADGVQRADRVTAVVAGAALEIRFPARVLGPGRVGQTVRIQPVGRNDVLEGRLLDSSTVLVEGT